MGAGIGRNTRVATMADAAFPRPRGKTVKPSPWVWPIGGWQC